MERNGQRSLCSLGWKLSSQEDAPGLGGVVSITSIGYDAAKRELEIEFRESRDVYQYLDVSSEEYAAFLAADSKGAYLNQVFKERNYPYFLVRR